MNTAGLRTDQAPPLWIPLGFFALAPLALVAAGVLLLLDGPALLLTHWHPRTIALVHLGTLGLLGSAMLGALYQMVPVVAGGSVPAVRLAALVWAGLVVGLPALVAGLWLGEPAALWTGTIALGLALLAFLVPVTVGLIRTPGRGETVAGMRVAVLALLALGILGLRLLWGHAAGDLPVARGTLLVAHVALGLVAWVGGLMSASSWQVVPMFYLTAAFPKRRAWSIVAALALTVAAVTVAVLLGASMPVVALAALPGAVAVWLVQPLTIVKLARTRKRRRPDPSLEFWLLGAGLAPVLLVLAIAAALVDRPELLVLFGWLAIWGQAGATVHGMLTRIVPFLVWFQRFASQVGQAAVPPMRQLWPDRQARVGLYLHAAALAVGTLAIVSGVGLLARMTGGLLVLTGAWLGGGLAGVLVRAGR